MPGVVVLVEIETPPKAKQANDQTDVDVLRAHPLIDGSSDSAIEPPVLRSSLRLRPEFGAGCAAGTVTLCR